MSQIKRPPLLPLCLVMLSLTSPLYGTAVANTPAPPESQQTNTDQQPITINADEMSNNTQTGVTTARGNVKIYINGLSITAGMITYDAKNDFLTATNQVTIVQQDGNIIEANYVDLNTALQAGELQDVRMVFMNKAQIMSEKLRKKENGTTIFEGAVYTPCEVCKEKKVPLWQIKAEKITDSSSSRNTSYKNARLEMWGVPIFYTPFFTHPSPGVKRRSGLLPASFGSNTRIGRFIKVPYYWDIAPNQDLTITPIDTSKQGTMLQTDYRRHLVRGTMNLTTSYIENDKLFLTNDEKQRSKQRWHISGNGQYHVNTKWRISTAVNRVSDKTYFKDYRFFKNLNTTRLKTDVLAERFDGRNYLSVGTTYFQDIKSKGDIITPTAAPAISYSHYFPHDTYGGRIKLHSNWRTLMISEKSDSQRASVGAEYAITKFTKGGLKTDVKLNVRNDTYYTNYRTPKNELGNVAKDGTVNRKFYATALKTSYPMTRINEWGRQLIEPMVGVVLAPESFNKRYIPNNDSTLITVDESNLFDANRSPGLDRTEAGKRSIYGIKLANYGLTEGRYSFFVGQSIRYKRAKTLTGTNQAGSKKSDYVGHLVIAPNDFLFADYRYHIDSNDNKTNLAESTFSIGSPTLKLGGRYTKLRPKIANKNQKPIRQLEISISSEFDSYWRGRVFGSRDLLNNKNIHKSGAVITYEDECFQADFSIKRDHSFYNNKKSGSTIMAALKFKTLTTYKTDNYKISKNQYKGK